MGDIIGIFRTLWEHFGKIIVVFFTIFAKISILNLWEGSKYVSGFKYVRVLNICKLPLIWQGSEYGSGCKYGRVLNLPGFRVCQVSAYASVTQGSEYDWMWQINALWQGSKYACSWFYRVLDKPPVQNMPGLIIWQVCKYVSCTVLHRVLSVQGLRRVPVTQGAKYAWISLNMSDAVHSIKSLCKLLSNYSNI